MKFVANKALTSERTKEWLYSVTGRFDKNWPKINQIRPKKIKFGPNLAQMYTKLIKKSPKISPKYSKICRK